MLNKDLELSLDTLRPVVFVITEEEDRLIHDLYEKLNHDVKVFPDIGSQLFIYRSTTGLCEYDDYIKEAERKIVKNKEGTTSFFQTLNEIYQAKAADTHNVYVLLDIDHYIVGNTDAVQQATIKLKDIILQCFYDKSHLKSVVIVSSEMSVPRKLQRYIEVIYYDLPTEKEIDSKVSGLIKVYNDSMEDDSKKIENKYSPLIIKSMKSLTEFEIEQITFSSIKRFKKLNPEVIESYKRSIIRKTNLLDILETNEITFDDVGGMDNLKEWLLTRSVAWTEEGIRLGVPALKGVLLTGITGTGKSLVSKAISNLLGLPLVLFNPSKLFSSRVGDSEANMIKTLKIVESIAPCVVRIDEIEKQMSGSQSSSFSDAGTTSRVIATFLTWYQDTTAPVFIVATCNNVEYLLPEMISRFDDKFFVNIPSYNERRKIFEIQLKHHYKFFDKFQADYDSLAKTSIQLTGREIEQVVKSSIHEMFYERRTTGKNVYLEMKHLMKVLDKKVPIVKTMENEIKYLIQWVGWDDKKQEGIRANWANKREDVSDDIDNMINEIMSSPSVLDKGKK
jgi:SpoVK/Ycf46/Vps4 family AAA+-type ATPase